MLRTILFSIGLLVAFCGTAFLLTDKIVIFPTQEAVSMVRMETPRRQGPIKEFIYGAVAPHRELSMPQWAAYLTLSSGAVTAVVSLAGRC